jgi:hypothetical protein
MHSYFSVAFKASGLLTLFFLFSASTARLLGDEPLATSSAPSPTPVHPLRDVLRYVNEHHTYITHNIFDYTCRIVKRERIDDRLQEYRYLDAKVRPRVVRDGEIVTPLSVYLRFLAPKKLAGRRLVYVEGQNEGKMLVRNGGPRLSNVIVSVSLDSQAARRESEMSVVDIGFDRMAREIIARLETDMKADPRGENTQVERLKDAKVNKRPCTHVRITHPQKQDALGFYRASVYVDDVWHLPVRLEVYDWETSEDGEHELLGEFTYLDVKVNVGLKSSEFTRESLYPNAAGPQAK